MTLNFPTGLLFVDPRTNSRLAAAQLSFFFTGTSGFISVYQDAALTSIWTQPIIADVNGNFPPNIYLDPFVGAGKCKIQLANSVAAVQWTVDPYYIPIAITQDSLNLRYTNNIFEVAVPAPIIATPGLTVNNLPGSVALRIIGGGLALGGVIQPTWEFNNATTGAQAATFGPIANKPGPSNSTPTKWLPVLNGATTYYIPCFL